MKKIRNIFLTTIVLIYMIFCCYTVSYAATTSSAVVKSSSNFNFGDFEKKGNENVEKAIKSGLGTVLRSIRIVATGISIIMLSYLGIKYMLASPSDRADFKKSMYIYIVGAILIFASGNILLLIEKFSNNL